MALIPDDIKKRIIHPDANAHIEGFERLFRHLNQGPSPERLRQLIESYFNDSPSLRGHLSMSSLVVDHDNNI
jgi:hypothetical protein